MRAKCITGSNRIVGTQYVEPLPARCGRGPKSDHAPQAAQVGAEDEVSRIHEIHSPFAGLGFVQPRVQFVVEKLFLVEGVLLHAFFGGTGTARERFQLNPMSLRNLRT